jgi:hypothetical protein
MKESSFDKGAPQAPGNGEAKGKTRRSFLGTTLPSLIMAGASLSILDHQRSQEKRAEKIKELSLLEKTRSTAEIPEYFAPINPIAATDAEKVAELTDGVVRIDVRGEPLKPSDAEHFRESISWQSLHEKPPFDFAFRDVVPRPRTGATVFEHVKYGPEGAPREVGSLKAMYAYSSRFRPICDAVERRYNLPHGLLTAMIMQETTGIEFLPNMNDGGFGLIHMQNSTAHEFGLNVSGDPKKTKDPANANELMALIKKTGEDPVALSEYDDRLNALANVDAAGRMLASWMSDPEVIQKATESGHLRRALCRYCGPNNWPKYWDRVCQYMSVINDPAYEKRIAAEFDSINASKRFDDDTPITFATWKKTHHEYYAKNYAVDEYAKLPLLKPKYTDMVQKSYQAVMRETEEENARQRIAQAQAKAKKK